MAAPFHFLVKRIEIDVSYEGTDDTPLGTIVDPKNWTAC